VHPVADEGRARGRLRLRYLVLVVGEDEVGGAAVDVEGHPELLLGHDRAFDVPPGTALAPRARPVRLPRLGRLPEREIEGIGLALVHFDARAGLELVDVAPREPAIARERADREVDIAVDHVRVAALDEAFDHADHARHGLRRPRLGGRLLDPEVGHRLEKRVRVTAGHVGGRDALVVGRTDDLVIDVGDVLDEADVVTAILEVAPDHVERQERARVPDVDVVVDRRPTDVHGDPTLVTRDELLFDAGHRVVETKCHGFPRSRCPASDLRRPSRRA
jgi:hypothetical protein